MVDIMNELVKSSYGENSMGIGLISYNTLGEYVERGIDGKIDFDATMAKFSTQLTEYEAVCEKEDATIADAVHAVFDSKVMRGGSVNMDAIVTFALGSLNPNTDNYAILRDRIKNWIRANSDQSEKKKEGIIISPAEPPRTRTFSISKGKGGGVRRWADIPIKPE